MSIGNRHVVGIEAEHQDYRGFAEMFTEMNRSPKRPFLTRQGFARQVLDRFACAGFVTFPLRSIQIAKFCSFSIISHHNNAPGLRVTTTWCPGGSL